MLSICMLAMGKGFHVIIGIRSSPQDKPLLSALSFESSLALCTSKIREAEYKEHQGLGIRIFHICNATFIHCTCRERLDAETPQLHDGEEDGTDDDAEFWKLWLLDTKLHPAAPML